MITYGATIGAFIAAAHTRQESYLIRLRHRAGLFQPLADGRPAVLDAYPAALKKSWVWEELSSVRNIRPFFGKFGMYGGLIYSALDIYLFRGKAPWYAHPRSWRAKAPPALR